MGDGARAAAAPRCVRPVVEAQEGDLAPLLHRRHLADAVRASTRGVHLLVAQELLADLHRQAPGGSFWVHPFGAWALAGVLDTAQVPDTPATLGEGTRVEAGVVLGPRVVAGRNVTLGAGSILGRPGFGWVTGPGGALRAMPQLGGVVIEDDVSLGGLCTVDAGTLGPTRIRRGAKLDAQVHVAHNVDIGEGTLVAAQSGFAGSVKIGRGVLVGGQVGVADHVHVGDGARLAAKSGVIGDVPAGATYGGYPAMPRGRWLRGLARLHRAVGRGKGEIS